MSKPPTSTGPRSFADDPQRNPKRDDIQDEGPRELFINNPDHPLKAAQKKGKRPSPDGSLPDDAPEPVYHPKPTSKVKRNQP